MVCSFLSSHGFGAPTQQAYKKHFTNIILLKFSGLPVRSVRSDIPILQMRNLRLQRGGTTCPKSHGRHRYGSTGSHRWRWVAIFTGSSSLSHQRTENREGDWAKGQELFHNNAKGTGVGPRPLLEKCPRHSEPLKENGSHHWVLEKQPSSGGLRLCFPIFKPHRVGM